MSKARKIVGTTIRSILIIVFAVIIAAVNSILPNYARMMDSMIGGINTKIDNSDVDTTGLDLEYNKADYTTDNIGEAESALHQQIADEGTVLLSNEGILPMAQDTEFSFFSVNSATVSASDSMMGGRNLTQIFEKAGAKINTTLMDFYSEQSKEYGLSSGSVSFGDAEDFAINEVPLSVLQENAEVMESVKNTVPVYFLKRVAGEGRDMPRSMYNHAESEEDKAKPLLDKIDSLYKSGNYRATLDSIVQLREHYPQAIEARKTALRLWQNASLKLAQADVASTDIKLQEMTEALKTETNLYRRNMMTVKRDSLQARYEAMCGVVRMIHLRQKQH